MIYSKAAIFSITFMVIFGKLFVLESTDIKFILVKMEGPIDKPGKFYNIFSYFLNQKEQIDSLTSGEIFKFIFFSIELGEPASTTNGYRAGNDWLRHWRSVGKHRMRKFKEQKRKEWKLKRNLKRWLKGLHSESSDYTSTDFTFGRRAFIRPEQTDADEPFKTGMAKTNRGRQQSKVNFNIHYLPITSKYIEICRVTEKIFNKEKIF